MVLHAGMFSETFQRTLADSDVLSSRQKYLSADPFPHIVLSDVFSWEALCLLGGLFPKPSEDWWKYDNVFERKFAKDDVSDEHVIFQAALSALQARPFVTFLERLTGIQGLIVDHTLRGGGLHQIARGGKLDVHADYNVHPVLKLDRRINVLLYLNQGWREEWKGHLELWNREMNRCIQAISPKMGTMVIFSTTDWSFHGHPEPLEAPEGTTRKSIALYYYSNGRPAHERSDPHSVLYQR